MKKIFTSLTAFLLISGVGFSAQAQDFEVPEVEFTIPYNGQAELLYNMFQITWGYYGLVDNCGDDPITCELTWPDGTVSTVKGTISDANKEGTNDGSVPTTESNALSFRNFMTLDEETMQYIQQYGTYEVYIPAAIVLVNGVPNPESTLHFTITGIQEEKHMSAAEMVFPTSSYLSYADAIQLYWPGQNIYFVEDVDSVSLQADIDGESFSCSASIQQVEGGNEDGSGYFSMDILYITFDDFISYADGTDLTVRIPEGIVANEDGEVNPAQTVQLTLLPQIQGEFNPEDNSELALEDAFVNVVWEGISVQPLKGETVTAREISGGKDIAVDVIWNDDASITVDLSTLPAGRYEIIIPEAFVIVLVEEGALYDKYAINSEMFASFTIMENTSGINSVRSESNVKTIYSIDGKKVTNESDTLKPGLYIINGSKTLIK